MIELLSALLNITRMYIYRGIIAININLCIFANMNTLDISDLYERSNNDIILELGERFRDYRIALRMTQKDIAEQSGVSVMTIVRFEKGGGGSIRLDTFMSLLRTIQNLEGILGTVPEMPVSLYDERKARRKQKQRVRRKADER